MLPCPSGLVPVEVRFGSHIEEIVEISTSSDLPILTAGLVDTHIHGLLGNSVRSDSDVLLQIAKDAASFGVTRTILSLVSSTVEETESVLNEATKVLGMEGFSGIHLEGPFLAPSRCGAHQVNQLRSASDDELNRYLGIDSLASITIAPEQVSASQAKRIAAQVTVAVGHTDCDYSEARQHFAAGASVLTHALNAMQQFSSRAPGPLAAAVEAGALVEIIADGHHLHRATVKALFNMASKPVLVSDSIGATGMPDGLFQLGEVEVNVAAGKATRLDNGALAGSTLTLNQAVANCVEWGVDVHQAVAAASSTPAQHYGIGQQEVIVGSSADLVLWNQFHPLSVFRGGELVHGSLIG